MPTARKKRERNVSGLIRCATTQLAVAAGLATLGSSADAAYNLNYYPYSYLSPGDFRACAGRLLKEKISPDAAAAACSETLDPRVFSSCVVDIKRKTTLTAVDAFTACRQARRPNEVASCVIGISRNSGGKADPAAANYCGNSLLPVRFADCVVGLRRASKYVPTQAMDYCSSATDQLFDLSPTFVPQNGTPSIPYPTENEIQGTPSNSYPAPGGTQNLTPSNAYPTQGGPQNLTPPSQSIPTPSTPNNPVNPGGR
jgi:hypothetical protein